MTEPSKSPKVANLIKIKAPFPLLPSFTVGAIVLSYLDYADEIFSLLNLLCKNTGNYAEKHREMLRGFIVSKH